jgi:hypothetical protein
MTRWRAGARRPGLPIRSAEVFLLDRDGFSDRHNSRVCPAFCELIRILGQTRRA